MRHARLVLRLDRGPIGVDLKCVVAEWDGTQPTARLTLTTEDRPDFDLPPDAAAMMDRALDGLRLLPRRAVQW